jgi:DNA repair ATPase RecN
MDQGSLNMLKNRHLLGAVVGLGALSALLGTVAVFRESRNGSGLVAATRERQNDRQQLDDRDAQLAARLEGLEKKLQDVETKLNEALMGVRDTREDLDKLMRKKPVTAEKLAPYLDRLERLEKRLAPSQEPFRPPCP